MTTETTTKFSQGDRVRTSTGEGRVLTIEEEGVFVRVENEVAGLCEWRWFRPDQLEAIQ